ncbi:hypothetical protein V1514DRAFT_339104 [Lipomyces japonicus]|uniref:uncharacterized protein n=1 Tax=Lipomyces japonicus TaxID=56871 RepID=UPI0034CE9677
MSRNPNLILKEYIHGEFLSTLYDVAPTSDNEAGLIYILPGNPGLPQYYVPFIKSLQRLLPDFRMVCVSQAGCDTNSLRLQKPDFNSQRYYDLDDQVLHKLDVLKLLLKRYGYFEDFQKKRVIIIGHSIGCWILQNLLLHIKEQNWKIYNLSTIMLFPTVKHIGQSSSGRKFRRILKFAPNISILTATAVYYFCKYLPNRLLQTTINLFMNSPPKHGLLATEDLIYSPSVVYQCVKLGEEEMSRVAEEADNVKSVFWSGSWNGSGRPGNIMAFFAHEDHWIGEHTRAELLQEYSMRDNVQFEIFNKDDGIKHSFCLWNSETIARKVSIWIKKES